MRRERLAGAGESPVSEPEEVKPEPEEKTPEESES
jgi:hypothetical protein